MRAPALILLAAGGSSRMGRPKQLLPWGDQSLLRHQCHIALQTVFRPLVVVLGGEAEACCIECADLPVTVVTNENWALGLGASIGAGIRKLEEEAPAIRGTLLMLVDQPAVTAAWLEQLAGNATPASPLVATDYEGKSGVPAYFDRQFFAELRELPTREGARALLAREDRRVRRLVPARPFFDLDTPESYREHAPST